MNKSVWRKVDSSAIRTFWIDSWTASYPPNSLPRVSNLKFLNGAHVLRAWWIKIILEAFGFLEKPWKISPAKFQGRGTRVLRGWQIFLCDTNSFAPLLLRTQFERNCQYNLNSLPSLPSQLPCFKSWENKLTSLQTLSNFLALWYRVDTFSVNTQDFSNSLRR